MDAAGFMGKERLDIVISYIVQELHNVCISSRRVINITIGKLLSNHTSAAFGWVLYTFTDLFMYLSCFLLVFAGVVVLRCFFYGKFDCFLVYVWLLFHLLFSVIVCGILFMLRLIMCKFLMVWRGGFFMFGRVFTIRDDAGMVSVERRALIICMFGVSEWLLLVLFLIILQMPLLSHLLH